ncbi:cation transporting ATPase C-terminal domain-containing protein, partial [Arthrospira platensis SPKY1]|nr:cation transporting ATPase C-terminal domain-containing protein [Arthrospira platensis SPKY1]
LLVLQADGRVTPYELTAFFTVFVLLQFWNLFNVRCLGSTRSAFAGILRNRTFLAISGAILIGQFVIVQFGGGMFRTVPLAWDDWLLMFAATSAVLWTGEVV